MSNRCSLLIAFSCLLASASPAVEAGASMRKIVLPNPRLIHCHSPDCSQLWKQVSDGDAGSVYPSQIMTDLVKGEVVGLTAVYDKSVSAEELRATITTLYGKSSLQSDPLLVWRVEQEQFAVMISNGMNGATQVTYLKFGTPETLRPSAHIDCRQQSP